jgi:poly-gamma-glutamate synthesis protein (capsule biosynthesis protein)
MTRTIVYHSYILILFCFAATPIFSQNPEGTENSIRLIFAGDIMGHDGQIESATIKKDKIFDYADCFKYIQPVLQQADLAIGNLELTLPGTPPYAGYPTFRSPDTLASELRYAGFDILMTANNHSNDAKLDGLLHTISVLNDAGFYHTGTFQSKEERAAFYPLVVYKKGFKLVFLNYTYGTNNPKDYPPAIINRIDESRIKNDMNMAKSFSPDAIIVVMHWGKEYLELSNDNQKQLANKIFSWGATIVIGAHPHFVQDIEKSKGTNNGLVAYSLGNFISGQTKQYTDGGILLEVELSKNLEKETHVSDYSFIPIWRYIQKNKKGKKTFMTIPIAPFEEEDNPLSTMPAYPKKAMQNYAKYIRQHMKSFDCKERKISLQEIE